MASTLEKLSKAGIISVNEMSVRFDTSSYTYGSAVIAETEKLLRESPKPTKIVYVNCTPEIERNLFSSFGRTYKMHHPIEAKYEFHLDTK